MSEFASVAVLGANGFVGSHLVDKLAADPELHVAAFDRFSRDPVYEDRSNVEAVRGDFFDAADVDRALEGADCVFHCFTSTNPSISDQDPLRDVEMVRRTVEIFSRCVELGVQKVVFISSGGAVYGEPRGEGAFHESDRPNPLSPYGIGKLAMEQYLGYFGRKAGLASVSFRLTNPYGPRQVFKNGQGVIAAFAQRIRAEEPLTLYGDGSSSRDYIYVEDAASMIAETYASPNKEPVYNLGSGEQTDLNTIIALLEKTLHATARVEHRPEPPTFLQRTDISMDLFWAEFGMRPLVSMEEGLRRTFDSLA